MNLSTQQNRVLIQNNKDNLKLVYSKISPWFFVLPGIFFTAWLRYYPIMKSLYMSLFDYNVMNPPGSFIGLKNFSDILKQQYYWDAWKNTLVFLGLTLILNFFIPIIQAIFLNELLVGKKILTTIYLIVALVPISVNVILWKWVWHPDYGIANVVFKMFGLQSQMWLSDPNLTKFCIVFPGIIGGGVAVLMYLAAIQGISTEIYESAKLDGCVGFKRIFYILLPNIKFMIFMQLVMTVIGTMQILDAPYQYASGGPNGVSTSMSIFIYKLANEDLAYGRSNAASFILFGVIAVMTTIQLKLDKSETE